LAKKAHMAIQNLATHRAPFVTVGELASYWLVSPQQIRRQIDAGVLEALRLGPRLYRIPVTAALRYERELTRRAAPVRRTSGGDGDLLRIPQRRERSS
jgi:excisionase family DNA binding protein